MYEQTPQQADDNPMALASMIIGIISIVASCCCFGGMILGSLAVVLACLSRVETCFDSRAKAGIICGIIGMVLGIAAGILVLQYFTMGSYRFGRFRFY